MQLGVVGLGRMGGNIVRRLLRAGHYCVVHDRDPAPGRALAGEGATRRGRPCRARRGARRAAGRVGDAALGRSDRGGDRGAQPSALARRHGHRRRQLVLEGRRAPRRGARRTRPRLSRRRHERRGVGARARLLPDDRRRGGGGAAARPDLPGARARPRRHPGDRRARRPRRPRRGGLPPCRAERRRPFRQDDP